LVQLPQAHTPGHRSKPIRSLLRPLTLINVISVIAFVVIGGSAFAAISGGESPAGPAPSTQPIGQPATPGENPPQLTDPPVTTPDSPAPAEENQLPASLLPNTPAAPASAPDGETRDTPPSDDQQADSPASPQTNESEVRHTEAKPKQAHQDERRDNESGGPPPWAPAYGFRCKRAGNAPGSPAFHDCIKSHKKLKRARPHGRH